MKHRRRTKRKCHKPSREGGRRRLGRALKRAGRAAKAKAGRGVKEYMELVVADPDYGLRPLFPNATGREDKKGGDAWAALLEENNKVVAEKRPSA